MVSEIPRTRYVRSVIIRIIQTKTVCLKINYKTSIKNPLRAFSIKTAVMEFLRNLLQQKKGGGGGEEETGGKGVATSDC